MCIHVCNHSSLQVPGAYFLTDCFLEFDRRLESNVFKPDKKDSKVSLASKEAVVMKKLIGALRALWRSSKSGAQDENIMQLKRLLLPSPPRSTAGDVASQAPSSDEEQGEERGEGEDQPEENGHDDDSDIDGETSSSHESPAEAGPSGPSQPPVAEDSEEDSGDESEQNSLTAPTLKLGEESHDESVQSSDSEDSMHRCSQVSSGWQGRAIMHGNEMERKKNMLNELRQREEHRKDTVEMMVDEIRRDIETSSGYLLLGTKLWEGYANWCRHAFNAYGNHVYDQLATLENYHSWVRQEKAKDLWVLNTNSFWTKQKTMAHLILL